METSRSSYPPLAGTGISFCPANQRLLEAFADAVRDLTNLHEYQFQAVIEGDTDSGRFDFLIQMAIQRKLSAKQAYVNHLETHGC